MDSDQNPSPAAELPKEVWIVITEVIEDPADLLSLSRVCRFLRSIIVPVPLHFRNVRCNYNDPDAWDKLCSTPLRAESIWRLSLTRQPEKDRNARWPCTSRYFIARFWGIWPYRPGWATPMSSAVPQLVNLRILTLHMSFTDFCSLGDFFRTVARRLDGLHIDITDRIPYAERARSSCLPVVDGMVGGYQSFTWKMEGHNDASMQTLLNAIANVLEKCPSLEVLSFCLSCSPPLSGNSLLNTSWPLLRTLSLSCLDLRGSNLAPILSRLSNLEVLHIADGLVARGWSTPTDALPKLRACEVHGGDAIALLSLFQPLTNGCYRPIDNLCWIFSQKVEECQEWHFQQFCWHAGKAGGLRQLDLSPRTGLHRSQFHWNLRWLVPYLGQIGAAVPSIEHLVIYCCEGATYFDDWLSALSTFSKMKSLCPGKFEFLDSFCETLDEGSLQYSLEMKSVRERMTKACPNLEHVGDWLRRDDEHWEEDECEGPCTRSCCLGNFSVYDCT